MSETLFEEKFPIFTFQWSNQVSETFQIKQTSLNIDRWKDNFSRLMVSQFSGFWICKSLDLIKFSTLVTKIVKTKLEKKDQVFGLKVDGHLLQGAVQSPQKRPIFLRAFSATCNLVVTINRISITQENCRSKMIVCKQSPCHCHYSPKLPSSHCWYCRVPLRCGPVVLGKERTLR